MFWSFEICPLNDDRSHALSRACVPKFKPVANYKPKSARYLTATCCTTSPTDTLQQIYNMLYNLFVSGKLLYNIFVAGQPPTNKLYNFVVQHVVQHVRVVEFDHKRLNAHHRT